MKPLTYDNLPLDLKTIINTEYCRIGGVMDSYGAWKYRHAFPNWTSAFARSHYELHASDNAASFAAFRIHSIEEYPDITQVSFDPKLFPIYASTLSRVILFKSFIDTIQDSLYSKIIPIHMTMTNLIQKLTGMIDLDFTRVYLNTDPKDTLTYTLTLPVDLLILPPEAKKSYSFVATSHTAWDKGKMTPNQLNYGRGNGPNTDPNISGLYTHNFLFKHITDCFNEVTAQYPKILHNTPKLAAKLLHHYIMCDYKAYSTTMTFMLKTTNNYTYSIGSFLRLLLLQQEVLVTSPKCDDLGVEMPIALNIVYCLDKGPLKPIPLSSLDYVLKDLEPTYKELTT